MKRILIQVEPDALASVFDQITAYDAGVDQVLPYGSVRPEEVANLVYGAIFTRGGDDLRNTAIFIGGTNVSRSEELLKNVNKTFFANFRVSVMFDANGCNTTAAALVQKITRGCDVSGKKPLILAGTGPVGIRAATLLSQEGCEVRLSSRQWVRAEEACRKLQEKTGFRVEPVQIANAQEMEQSLEGINIVAGCGAPGVRLLEQKIWATGPSLEILADINAVEPLGVEGIKVTDDGREREGKTIYGAIAIGNLKMKIHRAAVRALFENNKQILDVESIYALATGLEV